MTGSYRPEGFGTVTPYLIVEGADGLLEFVEKAFDADVLHRVRDDAGALRHAAVRIGDSMIEVSEARTAYPARPGVLHVYVPDVDATYRSALAAGAESLQEPADMDYGERGGGVEDPSGNQWWLATMTEEVSPEQAEKRLRGE